MPNTIGVNGLTTQTQAELITQLSDAFRLIFGNDINLSSDTPDGQLMLTFIQEVLDLLDFVRQVNAQFDPDQAIGAILDQRVGINGIQRQSGTHTVTNVTITTTQSLTLNGAEQNVFEVFTVADNAGNKFELIESVNLPSPGENVLAFEAVVPGVVLTNPNTITVPVTIVLGVSDINNPTTATTIGLSEESDVELKIRRQKSTSLSSQGYLDGLLAALENISGVTSAFVYENVTGSTDADGIPSHSIWVIVSGTGAPAAIANAIYTKRNAGCGMKGDQDFGITQVDGSIFLVHWDDVEAEDLFIKFTATSLDGVNAPNIDAIKEGLASLSTSFNPGVSAQVNINDLATAVQEIDNNTLVTNAGFSTTSGGSYTNTLTPTDKNKQFVLSADNIIITPIIVTPAATTSASLGTKQFSAIGGFGTYTWSIHTDSSGGASINSSTGLYTAGSGTGTDVVRVTDSLSNTKDANVVVS